MNKTIYTFVVLIFSCSLFSQLVIAAPKPLVLTEKEKKWLAEHPVIKVGIDAGYAPYSFLEKGGSFIGVAPDFIALISKKLGIKIEAVPDLSWPQIVDGARERTLDVIATAVITEERKKFLGFTEIYIPTPLVIMSRTDDDRFKDSSALNGRTVALVKKYSSSQQVVREYPSAKVIAVDTVAEGLHAVASGKADSYVGVIGINLFQAQQQGITNLKVASNYNVATNGQRFGVRSDWPELVSLLERALNSISEVERKAIYDKWISVSYVEQTDYSLLWKLFLAFIFIMSVMLFYNRRMAAEINHRKLVEEKLLDVNNKLETAISEANIANKAKSEFLSIMSHELRTPLTSIKGALGLMLNDVISNIPKEAKKLLLIASNNSERLNLLVNDILDYEKLQSGKMIFHDEKMELNELVRKAVELNQGYADEYHIHVDIRKGNCEHCLVTADENRLLQVLSNFMSNAIKYSPKNGTVYIDMKCTDNTARISVTDQGKGIPEEFYDDIFSHFTQADTSDTRDKGGSGLGLAISKEIIEHCNGKIGFENLLEGGACFYFDLEIVS